MSTIRQDKRKGKERVGKTATAQGTVALDPVNLEWEYGDEFELVLGREMRTRGT
jgi:hypothetical protein